MYYKKVNCPIVIRTPMGGRRGYGPTHSQTFDRLISGITNTTTIALNSLINPQDIYRSIVDNECHPVVVIENKLDYGLKIAQSQFSYYVYEYTKDDYPIVRISPFTSSPDVTVICWGGMANIVLECLPQLFEESEILVEVIVLSRISPLNYDVILESVIKTKRLVIVEEGTMFCGIGSEISASVHEITKGSITSKRLASLPVPIPSVKSLEKKVLVNTNHVIKVIEDVCI